MCSNACECISDATQSVDGGQDKKANKSLVCKKCRSAPPFIIMEKIHVHCKECFVEACRKKFRATLGKSKMLTHGDRILVAYSGGQSSSMLLDLVHHSLQCDQHKQLKFTPTILYVDMSITLDEQPHVRAAKVNDILSVATQLYPSWKFLWTTVEASYKILETNPDSSDEEPSFYAQYLPSHPVDQSHRLLNDHLKVKHFKDTLNSSCPDLTNKLDLVQRFLRKSIQAVAQQELKPHPNGQVMGSQFIFTGSTSSQLATNLMIDVILGQGTELQACVGFSDSRDDITALRPLREFSKKEVAFYLIAQKLNIPTKTTLSTLSERKASIHRVTESFLNKLYVEYPATYYTLLRIGNKMQT